MTPLTLLLLLLIVAYVGGHWAAAPGKRAFGSASGLEYVLIGAVLGPHGMGMLEGSVLATFEPVSLIALGWIALGYGVEVGAVGDQGVRRGPVLCGLLLTGLIAAATAVTVHAVSAALAPPARILLSAAVGLVSAQSARDVVLWMAHRHNADGPVQRWLVDFSRADDAPVLLSLPFLFAAFHEPHSMLDVPVGPAFIACFSLLLGALLGLSAAWLTHISSSRVERWTILLGSGWLATGISESIGLSAMGSCFALGMMLSLRVKNTEQVRDKLSATEGPVLLPALLLAGAHLAAPSSLAEWQLLGWAMLARTLVTLSVGGLFAVFTQPRGKTRMWFAPGLLSSGTLSIIVAFALLLRFDGEIGRTALLVAFTGTLLGELIGTPSMRRALVAAGDLQPRRDSTDDQLTNAEAQ